MIPIADPAISDDARARVENVIDSGILADGSEVREFEAEFSDYCGVDHGVATANGTAALHAALEAVGIGDSDAVLTTPFSFIATANAIRFAGAEPVFADIDPGTYNMDPRDAEAIARERDIDAIVPVHLYGLPAEMEAICELAAELDVPVIEDAAQAHGATYDGERVGAIGDVACFSFYPTKNMTTGEGGMVVTDREAIAESARRFIDHGRTKTHEHASLGHNFRMTNIAAAIGRAQFERLPEFVETRRANAARLNAGLESTSVTAPIEPARTTHVYNQYTIRCDNRERLETHLENHGIDTGVYYPTCIHNQPAYDRIDATVPNAEEAAREVLSLPVHPNVSENELERIVEVISDHDS
ncbi:DegT/DnrJ/EryC1/StrS family aminotransferase [Halosolutus gelatinilyticus]|uniref:DegT/DnrJ/EryC1/StrS family aminotransferase n=1 Tax=Halosolutus gelatinilyticus TaxID=2931975 RepID=UPI001FF2B026|nr:DegT/DnrJ/EryC1/StrS family aminotransferase [Halosolutus gelatinilyticus]